MKEKSLIVFITHILAFLCICVILGCSVESSSGEEKPVVATYTVSYSSDYATEQVYKLKPVTVQEGTVLGVEQLPVLSETGYTFIGWYDGEKKVIAGAYKVTKNVTLVAKWDEKRISTYKVEYFLQNLTCDGYDYKDSVILYGKVGAETVAVAKNYSGFIAQKIEQVKIKPDGSTVIEVKYDRKTVTITVNLDGGNIDGDENNISVTGKFETKTSLNVDSPEKIDCKFGGWSMDIPEVFPADDIEIKALWGNVYTITYLTDKGSVPNKIRLLENSLLNENYLPVLNETGWIFEGWYDGESKISKDEYIVTKNVVLVAKWAADTVNYTVEHWQQNITDNAYTLFEYNYLSGKTGELTAAVAENYPGFIAQSITQTEILANSSTVVKICYDRKKINLIFNLEGGNIDGKTENLVLYGKFGENIPSVARPEKENCVFGGWKPAIPDVFPEKDETYTALYIHSSISVNVAGLSPDFQINKVNNFTYKVTIPKEYTDIHYYIDGIKQAEAGNEYVFIIPKKEGCYSLLVTAKKTEIIYSCSYNVVIGSSDL